MPKGRPHLSRRQPEINESNRAKRAFSKVWSGAVIPWALLP
jgi:hypothetical protein